MKNKKNETEITKINSKENLSLFSDKRKPIINAYSGIEGTRRYLKKSNSSLFNKGRTDDLSSFVNGSYLDPYFRSPSASQSDARALSKTLYATNRIYQNVIDYLTNMFYWRSVVTPKRTGKKQKLSNDDYKTNYNKMLEVVDGFNIRVLYPSILKQILIKGSVYLYAFADKSSKTVSMLLLPQDYCAPALQTPYGTTQILFDFTFFDKIATNEAERKVVFSLFPSEFETLYTEYKANNSKPVLPLNPKFSTCISMNEDGFPTLLSIFYDIIDYKTYKMNELDRNTNVLERLVTHEIDLEKTHLEMPEVEELHSDLASIINGNGTTLVTSVGTLKVQQLQEEMGQENKALSNAYKSIYDNGGFNNALFTDSSDQSLKVSIARDKSLVWNLIEQLVNFYNLAANNLFKFGTYQLSFRVLPISPYDEKEKLEQYRANASLGVGVVDFIVASGIPQIDLESTLELEEQLDLVKRLMPLQSSHTQSGSATDKKDAETNNETDEDKNNLDDNKVEVSEKE